MLKKILFCSVAVLLSLSVYQDSFAKGSKFKSADKNADGHIDKKEWEHQNRRENRQEYRHMDKNKDGVVDGKEKQYQERYEHQEKYRHMDRNKDGVVDTKEAGMQKGAKDSDANSWWKKKADTNGDGKLDPAEAESWKRLEKEKIDINGDGVIDAKEKRSSWMHARSKVNTSIEKRYDADSDGWLDKEETRKMLQDRQRIIRTSGKAKVDSEIEKQYDTDNDGIISRSEAAALKEDLGE